MSDNTSDAMIARLEGELEERNAFIQGVIAGAEDAGRDLTDNDTELIKGAKGRIDSLKGQLDTLHDTRSTTMAARTRAREVATEMTRMRHEADRGPVEYRSAGAYILDLYQASLGDSGAKSNLEMFHRTAAHQKTSDNTGVIPDPVIGNVINFIDSARPLVSFLGPQSMPSSTWHRPKVTQHTSVAVQGSAGAAADEKSELVSQKMTITRLNANAVTYGGYVNVSRQNIDFSSPQVLDLVINDLAAQYAIETEAATAALLATTSADEIEYDADDQDSVAAAVWSAVAAVYAATRGQGRLGIAVAPDALAAFGPLFQPYAPQNQQGTGFTAANFGQGVMGSISGVPVLMSSGLAAGEAFAFSTAGVEVYEQRVGALQVVEPSVLGVQVAYAGYFTPLAVELTAVIPLVEGT
jgi:HK97 family phage major capsid protein